VEGEDVKRIEEEIKDLRRAIEELRENLQREGRMAAWDQLLFVATSFITFIFSVMQALLPSSRQALLSFLPLAVTGLVMPLYVGYYRGAILLDSVVERMRGWMYLLFSLGVYLVNLAESYLRFSEAVSRALEDFLTSYIPNLPVVEVLALTALLSAVWTRRPLYIMAVLSVLVTALIIPTYLPMMIVLLIQLSLAFYLFPSYIMGIFRSPSRERLSILRKTGAGAYLIFLFSGLLSNHLSSCIYSGGGAPCYLLSLIYPLPFLVPGLWYEGKACKEVLALEGSEDESVICKMVYDPIAKLLRIKGE